MTNLRHASLDKYVIYFHLFILNIEEDMLAQKIKVKILCFVFPVFSHNNNSIYLMIIHMPRYLSKLSISSYIVHISTQEVKEYVKDRRECCKSAAMRCCLSLRTGSVVQQKSQN